MGVADHVLESISGHLSRRMLEHYSHTRIDAQRQALDALDTTRRKAAAKGNGDGGSKGNDGDGSKGNEDAPDEGGIAALVDVSDDLTSQSRHSLLLSGSPPSGKLLIPLARRDVRVVEGARLESVCRGNSTVGWNPTLASLRSRSSAKAVPPKSRKATLSARPFVPSKTRDIQGILRVLNLMLGQLSDATDWDGIAELLCAQLVGGKHGVRIPHTCWVRTGHSANFSDADADLCAAFSAHALCGPAAPRAAARICPSVPRSGSGRYRRHWRRPAMRHTWTLPSRSRGRERP